MRAQLIGAALLVAVASTATAQAPAQSPAELAEKLIRERDAAAKPPPPQPAPPPLTELTAAELAKQLAEIQAEEKERAILNGESGPFLQAKAAWEAKEWPPLLYAAGTLGLWLVGVMIVVWLIGAIVARFREQ